jgi:MOSC domain-containing protein YiiM
MELHLKSVNVAQPSVLAVVDGEEIYSADHWGWWTNEHGLICTTGTFGENLTLTGADETEIRIGDRFAWGEAILEVSQPRQPCFKFPLHTGEPRSAALTTISGRCGWYLRVIRQGAALVKGTLTRIHAGDGPSVREAFVAVQHRKTSAEDRARMAAHPAMAAAFREALLR